MWQIISGFAIFLFFMWCIWSLLNWLDRKFFRPNLKRFYLVVLPDGSSRQFDDLGAAREDASCYPLSCIDRVEQWSVPVQSRSIFKKFK